MLVNLSLQYTGAKSSCSSSRCALQDIGRFWTVCLAIHLYKSTLHDLALKPNCTAACWRFSEAISIACTRLHLPLPTHPNLGGLLMRNIESFEKEIEFLCLADRVDIENSNATAARHVRTVSNEQMHPVVLMPHRLAGKDPTRANLRQLLTRQMTCKIASTGSRV